MPEDRETLIRRAVDRPIASTAEGQTELGAGGLFEVAYPFVAVDVPDAAHDEIQAAFASIWGVDVRLDLHLRKVSKTALQGPLLGSG